MNQSTLNEMLAEMDKAPHVVQPSRYLMGNHPKGLDLEAFKQIGVKSFSLLKAQDPEVKFLHRHVQKQDILFSLVKTLFLGKVNKQSKKNSLSYTYLTQLLWEYVAKVVPPQLLEVEEPLIGSPRLVKYKERFVTQDLAHSLLEFNAIIAGMEGQNINSILELGAGYGRFAYVFLTQLPHVKYVIADIPPALYVAQSYLPRVFSTRKTFFFRPFETYEEIKQEFEDSSLCFLLPHQIEQLPARSFDLGVTVNTLHEMTLDKSRYYIAQFSRLLKHYFYSKQLKESYIPYADVTIKEADYALPDEWEEIFWRTCPVQTPFFEALFKMSP